MTLSKSMCHDSCICDLTLWKSMCVACDMHVICMSYAYVTWLVALNTITVCVCDMTCSYVTWFLHMWEHSIRTWHVTCMCDMHARYDIHINESLNTDFDRVISRMHMTCMWFACDLHVICMLHTYVTWLVALENIKVCVCAMTCSYVTGRMHVWQDACIRDVTYCFGHWQFLCVCLIDTWHESRVNDLFTRGMTHAHVTWLVHMWHDSFLLTSSGLRAVIYS